MPGTARNGCQSRSGGVTDVRNPPETRMNQMLPRDTTGTAERRCEEGCGCRYGTDDADRMECGCDGPCTEGDGDWYADSKRLTED